MHPLLVTLHSNVGTYSKPEEKKWLSCQTLHWMMLLNHNLVATLYLPTRLGVDLSRQDSSVSLSKNHVSFSLNVQYVYISFENLTRLHAVATSSVESALNV